MNNTDKIVNGKLQEAWKHIKPYMKDKDANKELKDMCKTCEAWCGPQQDYENCRDKPCFKFWLAYQYLSWEASWE